eukprot:15013696-Alexandrium_andersonii.AAC.1
MSASLVGSEMCIRDRVEASTTEVDFSTSGGRRFDLPRGPGRKVDLGDPVSYTHLTLPTICSV